MILGRGIASRLKRGAACAHKLQADLTSTGRALLVKRQSGFPVCMVIEIVPDLTVRFSVTPADQVPDLLFWADPNPGQGHLPAHKSPSLILLTCAPLRF